MPIPVPEIPLELRVLMWCMVVPVAVGSLLLTAALARKLIDVIRGRW